MEVGALLRRRRRQKNSVKVLALVFFLILVFVFLVIEISLKPTILAFAETQAKWAATEAIHRAVLEEAAEGIEYKDIVHIEKDLQNRIVFMQPNILLINKVASKSALSIQEKLEELNKESFKIPLGQMLGSKLLAHYGPKVNLTLLPIGTVKVFPRDRFEEAGINQTRHSIYLQVDSQVKIIIPFLSSVADVNVKIPLADAVIVGEVPDTYLNIKNEKGQGLFIPFNNET